MTEALTQKEAAARLGMSPRKLRRLTNQGEAPRNDDGSYPWPEVRDSVEGVERLTQKEAAERLGVTARHLRELTRRDVVSRLDDGSYPWPTIQEEHDQFVEEAEEARAAGFAGDALKDAKARKAAADARLAELKLREREAELIAAADVEALLREPLERVNVVLKNVPVRHGPRLAKAAGIPLAEAKALLSEIVETIRAELREVPSAA